MLKYQDIEKIVMVKIIEMDENVTLKSQLEEDVGPVIVVNKFTVKPEDVDEFLKVFEDTTKKFKQQPGFYLCSIASWYWWQQHIF